VDTLGHLLALHLMSADEQDRAQVGELARQVQQITEESVELAYVDQGYTGEAAEQAGCRARYPTGSGQAHPGPNVVLHCCRAAGLWREASPGRHGFAVWPATSKDSPIPWSPSMFSPSPAS
jgi:hypothetical protein